MGKYSDKQQNYIKPTLIFLQRVQKNKFVFLQSYTLIIFINTKKYKLGRRIITKIKRFYSIFF